MQFVAWRIIDMVGITITLILVSGFVSLAEAKDAKKGKVPVQEQSKLSPVERCMKVHKNEKLCGSIPALLKNLEDAKKQVPQN